MKKPKILTGILKLSIFGVISFYIVPFIFNIYYALTNSKKDFVALANFITIIKNPFFLLALKNTVVFIIIAVLLVMSLAFLLAIFFNKYFSKSKVICLLLVVPYFLPSGALILFWQNLFKANGVINIILNYCGLHSLDWINSKWAFVVVVVIYLWKNTGLITLILYSGLKKIPQVYFEVAQSQGANKWQCFKHVQLVYALPSIIIALIVSVVNSINIFKEIYLLYGSYPVKHIYMLQHFIYNQYLNLNIAKLTSSAIVLFIVVFSLLVVLLYKQKQVSSKLYYKNQGKNYKTARKRLWVIFVVIVVISVLLLPIIYTIVNSFKPISKTIVFSLKQYQEFFSNRLLLKMYFNSIIISLPIVIFTALLAIFTAYAFMRFKHKFINNIFTVYIIIMLLPKMVLILPTFLITNKMGLSNNYLAIILPAIFNPLSIFIISYALKSINEQLIEAALSCGANEYQVLFKVVLPNIKKYILLLIFIVFAEYWNTVDEAIIFIKNQQSLPLSVYLSTMANSNNTAFFATSTLYMAPIILIFVLLIII
ncbi:ABC transporter permease subunit [Clostridium sp. 'deep sea']|uniref:ABC transporter permease n=1 Tax=Clostridium sp. 'deep sea' TaxID=2779445 RepID=UPI00189691D6|nr:ABC transporter permease subunit [Clostridium sp. 'deep sea']QOR34924.1 ABC transporter permease subunit [Clostridium sp. 'deep sea']